MQTYPHEPPAPARVAAVDTETPLLTRQSTLEGAGLSALRVVSALLLMQHGVQKMFGLLLPPDRPFGGAPDMFSRFWVAGMLETFGAFLLLIGLFTRPVAFLLSGLMASAYFIAHAGDSFWPILNGGELAALFSFVFLAIAALGGGPFSIDRWRGRRTAPARPAELVTGSSAGQPFPIDRRKRRRRSKSRE